MQFSHSPMKLFSVCYCIDFAGDLQMMHTLSGQRDATYIRRFTIWVNTVGTNGPDNFARIIGKNDYFHFGFLV